MGLAFALSGAGGFEVRPHSLPLALPDEKRSPVSYVLFARDRGAPARSDLLCVAHDPQSLADVVELMNEEESRLGAMFLARTPRRPQAEWALMMCVWPDDVNDATTAELLAGSYVAPLPLSFEIGEAVRTDPGDLDNDGYNEAEGCYVIAPLGRRARFRLDATARAAWYPMFKVRGSTGRRVWVYADGLIVNAEQRTADGDVLFKLDRIVSGRVTVEVVLEPETDAASTEDQPGHGGL